MSAPPRQLFPAASASTSNPGSPSSSSTFPRHDSLSLNGSGYTVALRPAVSLSLSAAAREYSLERVRAWDDDRVAAWLGESRASQYADTFRKHDIRGNVLLDVDQRALKEMGIKTVADRVRLVVAVRLLRQRCFTAMYASHARQEAVADSSRHADGKKDRAGRGSGRIPPPLHLAQSNAVDLPQAWQPPPPPATARSLTAHARPLPSPQARAASVPPPPPSLPPPRALPLPAPPATATVTASASDKLGERNDRTLPPAPAPPSQPQPQPRTTTSPAPLDRKQSISSGRPPVGAPAPRPSTSSMSASHRKQPSAGRPSTTQAAYAHPYANANGNPSPTSDAFSTTVYGRNPVPGAGLKTLLPSPAIGKASPSPSEQSAGFSGAKSGFARPTTPAGVASAGGPVEGSKAWGQESLDAVLRKTIKLLGDDGVSKTVAVADCRDGNEVLARVLRKFQKLGGLSTSTAGSATEEEDQWGVFTSSSEGQHKLLTPTELFALCLNAQATERHSLAVRRIPAHLRKPRRPFQPATPEARSSGSPTSPNYLGVEIPSTTIEPASPAASTASTDSPLAAPVLPPTPRSLVPTSEQRQKMKRASTISIMSGLGGDELPAAVRSPSSGSFLNPGRKLRSFFGQRPPSELIATHLTEYFPRAEKRLLSKSVRQSMRRSMVRRESQYSVLSSGTSWEREAAMSRFSGSSTGSVKILPNTPEQHRQSLLLELPDEGEVDGRTAASSALAQRRLSRLSTASRASWARDDDAASMVTVDEVTAELETRRASMATSYLGEDDEEPPEGNKFRPPSIAVQDEDGDEDYSDDYDDDDDDDDEQDVEELPSEAAKPALKWIKGALIGAGSFGSVYLGMNPMSGSLMAVKQVELPTGNSHNEERKKSMLDALEREIELLKVLQHENIVQYLDSSSDATHLNIFLEYVPGGSVAALLSNYGAFEEALVSKFVRQILTGLEYLHEREIIHRDIKGANILVDNKGGIKISDFGISKKVEDNLLTGSKVHRPSLQGSVYWMAPEVVKQTSYTSKADIWSLGCLVVEMLTGAHPWANLTQMQAIFRIGSTSSRPTIPDDISTEADDFLARAFEQDHNERPAASALLLHAFIRDVEQQTPTRATFSQNASPVKEVVA